MTRMNYEDMMNKVTRQPPPFSFWEESLEIIHNCQYENDTMIKNLWRSILFSYIPRKSSDKHLEESVRLWRENAQKEGIVVDSIRDSKTAGI